MFPKLLLTLPIALVLLIPLNTANAQLDQRCWVKQACVDQRKTQDVLGNQTPAEIEAGFYQGSDSAKVCGGDKDASGNLLGFCLPAGQTTTKITFGGQTKFNNIGEFIALMYRYGIAAAAIAAVVIIMHSGLRWVTSGGNSEQISASKKKIGGAMMGLFLAILSFSILNILNPAFVNLRLPQIWMVNTQGLAPAMCDAVQGKKLALKTGVPSASTIYPLTPEQTKCGSDYYVEGAGTQTCKGTRCEKQGQTCYGGFGKTTACMIGNIVGTVYNTSFTSEQVIGETLSAFGTENWEWEWINDMQLEAVCTDGTKFNDLETAFMPSQDQNDEAFTQFYYINISEEKIAKQETSCATKGGLKGFVLEAGMNEQIDIGGDEPHFLGKDGVDLGDYESPLVIGDEFFTSGAFLKKIAEVAPKEHFISADELRRGIIVNIDAGKICDIDEDEKDRKKCYGHLGY